MSFPISAAILQEHLLYTAWASQRLVQYQDELVGRAVNDIARPVS